MRGGEGVRNGKKTGELVGRDRGGKGGGMEERKSIPRFGLHPILEILINTLAGHYKS